jgi:hypothetical protein
MKRLLGYEDHEAMDGWFTLMVTTDSYIGRYKYVYAPFCC